MFKGGRYVRDKQAIKAMKAIKRYCKKHEYCFGCAFYHAGEKALENLCMLYNHQNPAYWKLEKQK